MESPQEIQSYEARAHWSEIIERVSSGQSYIIRKHNRSLAVLIPIAQWQAVINEAYSPSSDEFACLVEELNESNARTEASLNKAFKELAATRTFLLEAKRAREEDEAAEERAREQGRREMEALLG
ncbi:type II toxin-antitoxin system prevent-host-death family antitoxin [Aquisalimonas lutea]|uniref:type II toxin-antitoxin system Phd/YefM family antitoxin n=1 Tax=Aquisalimonas lutea TaxID=1327750 RepID=UPI0025B48C28|nr:type II toxin-antitoxin system prevent-host-death family antitoxin [Aquisalimonas lutea]MDN3517223.1 type II toxin-antitoxin system prevent-host-death family antitoxin [Aquisalimonas lutea]